MKIFLAYRFTGENPMELEKETGLIERAVQLTGHECTCSLSLESFFQSKRYTAGMIQRYMMELLSNHDVLLCYIKSKDRSEGLLLEAGQAIANKQPIIVAIKEGVYSLVAQPEIATKVITFNTLDELCGKIINREINIS